MDTETKFTGQHFLSCDWGTTSFRLSLMEIDTGKTITNISNSDGIQKVYRRWSAAKNGKNRVKYYLSFLKNKISVLKKKSPQRLEGLPIVVSGMASSTIGIKELPYRSLPIALDNPNLHVETIEATSSFGHDLYIISGIRSSDDLMRGEETQLLGLSSKLVMKNGFYLLVGTHSKHIFIKDKRVTAFKTYMTGELFDLVSTRSILANSISNSKTVPGHAFKHGVNAATQENMLHALFKIRAGHVLGRSGTAENYDFLSGLLIGAELKEIQENSPEHILLWGNHQLQIYYAAALNALHLDYSKLDINSDEDITSLGQRIILKRIYN